MELKLGFKDQGGNYSLTIMLHVQDRKNLLPKKILICIRRLSFPSQVVEEVDEGYRLLSPKVNFIVITLN